MAFSISTSYGCASGINTGFIQLNSVTASGGGTGLPAPGDGVWQLYVVDAVSTDYGNLFDPYASLPLSIGSLANGAYEVWVSYTDFNGSTESAHQFRTLACGPPLLNLTALTHTDETAALLDGTASITATGGTAPLLATLDGGAGVAAASGVATAFTALAPGTYTLRVTDAAALFVEGPVTIAPYAAPYAGCTDPEATNYDPGAATDDGSCTYPPPLWRSAWQPVSVAVAPPPGNLLAYVAAELIIGLPAVHPEAAARPQQPPIPLRATISPSGIATFSLGPYLRPEMGADTGEGRLLDLNSPTAATLDLYTGYVLRRPGGAVLQRGYVLNAAVPDAGLPVAAGQQLSPFARLPLWPGFEEYPVTEVAEAGPLGYLVLAAKPAATVLLPCPSHPLPVAWLAPAGGYGYWVFQGRALQADEVGDGQPYSEARTGETRWASRGETRRSWQASSGVFQGDDLTEGLRTLWASPQVWLQQEGEWLPVVLSGGSFPAGRIGVVRREVTAKFTQAKARWAQGQ